MDVTTIPIANDAVEETKIEDFVKPFHYVADNVRDKRRVQLQDDALELYNDGGEEMADLILPATADEGTNYADDSVLLDDSKLDDADDGTIAPESTSGVAATSSGNEEGSASEIESGMLSEASNQMIIDNDDGKKNGTNTDEEGSKRSSTCCLIE